MCVGYYSEQYPHLIKKKVKRKQETDEKNMFIFKTDKNEIRKIVYAKLRCAEIQQRIQ